MEELIEYEIGDLCPAEIGLYSRLGWKDWQDSLSIRSQEGLIFAPDERIMIPQLPKTPDLDQVLLLSDKWWDGELWQ